MKQVSQGIFIHKASFSENSLLVTFYTESYGIQKFIFQGGKKKAHGLFPCSLCELTYYKRPEGDLATLYSANTIVSWRKIPYNPVYGTVAFFIADFVQNVLKDERKDQELFVYLASFIAEIDNLDQHQLGLALIYFLIGFTSKLGIEPHIDKNKKRYFVPSDGVFTDAPTNDVVCYTGIGVDLIQDVLQNRKISGLNGATQKEVLNIMMTFYAFHIPSFNVNNTIQILREVLST